MRCGAADCVLPVCIAHVPMQCVMIPDMFVQSPPLPMIVCLLASRLVVMASMFLHFCRTGGCRAALHTCTAAEVLPAKQAMGAVNPDAHTVC